LPTFSQQALAAYILTTPFLQGMFALMTPISIFMIVFVKLPVFVAVLTFIPLYGFGLQACIDMLGLVEFMQSHGDAISLRVLLNAAVGYFPYQWLLAFSSLRAIVRQARNQTNWEKTAHLGAHRRAEELA
jgi:hypothetical protein